MAFSYEQKVYAKVGAGIVGATGVFLLQYHSVNFYAESFWEGNIYYGAVNSLFFEAAAVGLWSTRDRLKNVLAFLCTLMVLVGPVYQITVPLIDMLNNTSTKSNLYSSQLETIKTELKQKQETLAWYTEIKRYPQERVKLSERISELNDKKLSLEEKQAENDIQDASATWQAIAKILMQIIGVILTQIVVVLCVRFVSEKVDKRTFKPESWGKKRHATPKKVK